VPVILIGNDDQSDGCLFYNPATKNIIASSDYRLDPSRPSGPVFNLPHEENGFGFSILSTQNSSSHTTPPFTLGDEVYCYDERNPQQPPREATILTIPLSDDHPYTIQLVDGQVIEALSSTLSPNNPISGSHTEQQHSLSTYPWLTHGSKVTVFFTNKMLAPKQGYLTNPTQINGPSFQAEPTSATTAIGRYLYQTLTRLHHLSFNTIS
jgi:hypothetical protein